MGDLCVSWVKLGKSFSKLGKICWVSSLGGACTPTPRRCYAPVVIEFANAVTQSRINVTYFPQFST